LNKIFFIVFGLLAVASIAGLTTEFVNFDVQDFQFFGSFAEFDEAVCICKADDGTVSKENCQQFGGDIKDPNGVCIIHPDVDITDYGILPTNDQGCSVSFWKSHADESQVLSIWPTGFNPDDYYNDLFKTTIVSEDENEEEDDEGNRGEGITSGKKDLTKEQTDDDKVRDKDEGNRGEGITSGKKDLTKEQTDDDKVRDKDKVKDENKLNQKDKDKDKDENRVKDEDSKDDDTDKGPTLLEALNAKGGKMGHILQASVAALLNSAHSEVSYQYSVQEVISMTLDAINSENYKDGIDIFEELNEEGVRPPLCEDFDQLLKLDSKN